MLPKFNRLIKYLYQLKYRLMAIATVIIIFLFNLHSVKSQEVALTAIDDADIVDLQVISERVARLEARWENDYEGYFNRNFANQSRSAGRIAKHLKEIRERAQVNPAVIWAMPQKDFLQLMLITPERQFVIKQIRGANRLRLDSRIKELQLGIEDRQSLAYLPPARIIYSWLFEPLEPYLQAEQIDTLLLCTGPKLRSLPFAVLHDGEQFMVEKYNLARIPAFGLTDTSYAPKPDKQVLAMGTSEFDDFPSLPGVTVELETIVPKLWTGSRITEEDFTIANLQQARQQQNFDIVHIASHSVFRTGKPEKSFIQFSDRKLTLAQLAELDFDLPQVDLLVLSACETALGDESAEYGFAGLAMQAGVKSALASLWLIDDVGTVLLMSDFYQQLQYTPIKSAALRQAQLNLLHQQVTVDDQQIKGLKVKVDLSNISPVLQEQDFSHPYYWGGFTLIGNPW